MTRAEPVGWALTAILISCEQRLVLAMLRLCRTTGYTDLMSRSPTTPESATGSEFARAHPLLHIN